MRFIHKFCIGLCTGLVGFVISASFAGAEPLRVFVAASLADAVQEVVSDWPEPVVVSAAGSGTIARQIDLGAPADVVMLASLDWMDWLEARGRIIAGTRTAPVGNALVVVGPPDARPLSSMTIAHALARLEPSGRLALGEHRSVPAGQYAAEWMKKQGLWEDLRTRLAEVDSVRAALALVSRGEVPLAVVYRSDLVAAPEVATVVWDIPADQQPDIRYGVGAITSEGVALAREMASPDALKVFARFGFQPVAR